ncbi:MAG: hypothetical protein ABIO86_10780 [Sphingomonas sp.]
MKLFDLLHNVVEGMGQGQIAPGGLRWPKSQHAAEAHQQPKRRRPAQITELSRHEVLRNVAKVMVQARQTGPRAKDLCWLLADSEDRILLVMQSGKALDEGFFSWISNSPGFDRTAIRRAMRSSRKSRYTVWQNDVIAEKAAKAR